MRICAETLCGQVIKLLRITRETLLRLGSLKL